MKKIFLFITIFAAVFNNSIANITDVSQELILETNLPQIEKEQAQLEQTDDNSKKFFSQEELSAVLNQEILCKNFYMVMDQKYLLY